VAELGRASRDGVEHLEAWHQLAGPEDLDGQAAVGHLLDDLGEALGPLADPREVLRPGGDHLPLEGFLGLCRVVDAGDQHQAGDGAAHGHGDGK